MDRSVLVRTLRTTLPGVQGIRAAYLFGSRARGQERPDSDLDLAVAYDEKASAEERERARRDILSQLTDRLGSLGEDADVVDIEACNAALAFAALRDGVRLFVRDEPTRIRLEARIMRRYDDEAPRRASIRRAAIRAGAKMGRASHG